MSYPRLLCLFVFLLTLPLLAAAQRRPAPGRTQPRPPVARVAPRPAPAGPDFLRYQHSRWVDSLMRALTPRQRVAQLFMVAAYSNKTRADEDSVSLLVRDYGIGGLIWFQGGPVRQTRLLNRYQRESAVPLLVAMDGEWGAGMRLDSVLKFPYQMALGAVPEADSSLIYDMGREVARQFRRLGMHVNFAPVVDVNNNPGNPVIGFRSWGENPARVTQLSRLYMRGMQDAGVLAVAKHFPGHGDVEADSHLALPIVRVDRRRLDSLELPPFRGLIRGGVGGMMVAHLDVPTLDSTNTPTTLSRPVVTGLLRQRLGFGGVIFTDAMNMQGVISKVPTGQAEIRALLAGNDVLEFSKNVPVALRAVLAAVDSGRISQARIDESCRRVLALKQWAGLTRRPVVAEQHLAADLNPPHARYLSHRLTQDGLTLLRNRAAGPAPASAAPVGTAAAGAPAAAAPAIEPAATPAASRPRPAAPRPLLPLLRPDTLRLATLVIGGAPADTTEFQRAVTDYAAPAAHFHLPTVPTMDELADMRARLFNYDLVLVALQGLGRLPATSFGIAPETQALLRELTKPGQQVVLTVFGSAYAVARVRDLDRLSAVLVAYQESPDAQRLAAQFLFGGIGATGRLPVTVAPGLPAGFGLRTTGGLRLAYAHPEDAGMDPRLEARVDSLLTGAIARGVMPGAQALVARRGVVVLRKNYGYQQVPPTGFALAAGLGAAPGVDLTASVGSEPAVQAPGGQPASTANQKRETRNQKPVSDADRYDLASLTKLLAATPALLKLQERGQFSPDSTLGQLFPFLRRTDKAPLRLRDVLAHQAGLPAFIPFYKDLLTDKGELQRHWFRPDSSARFPLPVARGIWGRRELPAYVEGRIAAAPLLPKREYVYSDLSFYLTPGLVQRRTGQEFTAFLQREVYGPLGSGLRFQPLHHYPLARLLPTEYDSTFRHQLLRGYVHDEGAALLGGISGHAGLFGNANDVAQLAQAYAWGGRYGGRQLLDAAALADWTRCQFCPTGNRRALAFDRPAQPSPGGPSARSYGHTGFTGTYFWVDPDRDLVVVLLTNRVNPTRRSQKLMQEGIRSKLLQLALDAAR